MANATIEIQWPMDDEPVDGNFTVSGIVANDSEDKRITYIISCKLDNTPLTVVPATVTFSDSLTFEVWSAAATGVSVGEHIITATITPQGGTVPDDTDIVTGITVGGGGGGQNPMGNIE